MPNVEIIGPFEDYRVVVDGYRVPYLSACPIQGGKVLLCLDDRYMIEVEVAALDRTVDFIANCIAVGLGYTCHPGTKGAPEPHPKTPYSRMSRLGP